MAELHDLTALEQAAAVRRREVSPVDLVEHYLARIDAHEPTLSAFVTVTADAARAAARAAERAVATGADVPPLHGVPIAIKDLATTAGVRTTFGSAVFSSFVPDTDADVVMLLRQAGTISLGKTTTSEFGVSLYTETLLGPPTRNPWQLDLTPGGSSGGSAAAVAGGLVGVAHGSDGGGSLRIPASICGLVGYKPTRGLVSAGPLYSGGFGLPTSGPIGRTVGDVAAVLDAMAVPMPGEPYPPAPPPPDGSYLAATRRSPGRLRIGRHAAPMLAETVVDPACLAAWEDCGHLLESLGHQVDDIEPPFTPTTARMFQVVWAVLTQVPGGRMDNLLPLTRWMAEQAAAASAEDLFLALTELQIRVRAAMRRLAAYDLFLTPTLARPHARIGFFNEAGPAEDFARQAAFSPFCAVSNLTGQPAVSLPLGESDGLPVGVMLAARPGEDATLLSVAAQLEAARPWRERHPALWRGSTSATVNDDQRSSTNEGP